MKKSLIYIILLLGTVACNKQQTVEPNPQLQERPVSEFAFGVNTNYYAHPTDSVKLSLSLYNNTNTPVTFRVSLDDLPANTKAVVHKESVTLPTSKGEAYFYPVSLITENLKEGTYSIPVTFTPEGRDAHSMEILLHVTSN